MSDRREIAFKDLKKTAVIDVEVFAEGHTEAWDEFVWDSNNGTLFHSRKFLNYHPKARFEDFSLIFKKDRKYLAVLPAALRSDADKKTLISHPGASMGGVVSKYSISLKDTFRIVEELLRFADRQGVAEIIITLPPEFYHTRPSNYLDFALLESGFTYSKREVTSVIPLDFAEEDALLIFSPESRRAVRKAIKAGVEIRESSDFATFYSILEKNLNMRHNVQPTHSLDELMLLKELLPDHIRLFGAYVENTMIAGIVIFTCNPKVALAFYITHRGDMQEYRGVNALFYEVIRWARRNRFKFLDFGIFTVNMRPNWGLARFKESFGAQGVFRDTLIKTPG